MVESFIENENSRVLFPAGSQKIFLSRLQSKLNVSLKDFSVVAGVCVRSMTDWKREKNSVSLSGLIALCKMANIELPKNVEIKDRFWYVERGSKLGGLASYKKYGPLGSINEKYRKEKWLEWWEKKGKFNPNKCFIPKNVFLPEKSAQLSEFVGIILGDGGITKNQVSVTLNKVSDLEYSFYVKSLINNLFNVKVATYNHGTGCVVNIVVSRTRLVNFLLEMGLKIGNKVRQQAGIPEWICKSNLFTKFCMRGLLDTDGCFYVDKHRYKDKIYLNCGINFTNRSLPLLNFFRDNLVKFGYHPTQKTKFSIFLRREEEIVKYFKEIGSSNPKHLNKFNKYFNNKLGGVG